MTDERPVLYGLPAFDPQLLPKAIDFYSSLVRGKKAANPNRFQTSPAELIEDISETAFAVGQLPRWSARIKNANVEAQDEIKRNSGTLDPAMFTGLEDKLDKTITRYAKPVSKKLRAIEDLTTQASREYEPIPKGADAFNTVKAMARLFMEGGAAYEIMKKKGLNIDQAYGSNEFRDMSDGFDKDLSDDEQRLRNDPVFQRYVKDWPKLSDALTIGFTGQAAGAIIPARELVTLSMIAADDPEVKRHAFNIVSLQSGSMDEELQGLMQAASARITKAIFSRELQQRRILPDIVASSVLTSPLFLKQVGLPTNLPNNLISDALQGIGHKAISIKNSMKGTIAEDFVNFFRDRFEVRGEKLKEQIFKRVEQYLGKNTGPEVVAQIRERVEDTLSRMKGGVEDLETRASGLYKSFQDQIRSRFVDLSPEQQAAAILKHQNRRDLAAAAGPGVDEVFDTPEVSRAARFITTLVDNMKKVDPELPQLSNYFPAFQSHVENTFDALKKAAINPHFKRRDLIEAVVPITKGVGQLVKTGAKALSHVPVSQAIDDLAFRAVTPELNSLMTRTAKEADTIAAVVLSEIDEVIKNPAEKLSIVKSALAEVPVGKRGPITEAIANAYGTFMLNARWGSWVASEGLDGAVEATVNLLKRIKEGKAVSFSNIFKGPKPPPEIVADVVSSPLARDLPEAWRVGAWMGRLNDLGFEGNKMFDRWRATRFFEFNYGSELADIAKKTGVPVEELGQSAKDLAKTVATEATKRFALSFSYASALTTHGITTAAFPFLGFWTKATGRFIKDFGDVPELFKLAALAKAKVEDLNREYPNEYRSAALKVGGFALNPFVKLAAYPWISSLKDSFFGPVEKREDYLKKEAETIQRVADKDPVKAWEMLNRSQEPLKDYLIQQPGRAMANFFDYLKDVNFVPIGPPVTMLAEKAKLIDERSVHWFPGGKAFENLFRGLGLYEPNAFNDAISNIGSIVGNPEMTVGVTLGQFNPGALTARMRAYNQNKFDADVAVQYASILSRENLTEPELTEKKRKDLLDQANKEVRVNMLQNFFASQLTGMGQKMLPNMQEYWNALAESYDRRDLIVPTDEQIETLAAETGIEHVPTLYDVWQKTWPGILEFETKGQQARFEFLENFPGLKNFEAIQANRKKQDIEDGVRQKRALYGRLPYSDVGKFLPLDRTQRAYIQMLSSEPVYDEEGTVKGLKIKLREPNGRGAAILRHILKTPEEKIEAFKSGSPDIAVIQRYWPDEYSRLRLAVPSAPSPVPVSNEDKVGFKYVLQPIEDTMRSEKIKGFFESLADYVPTNPLDFPQHAAQVFTSKNEAKIKEYLEKGGKSLLKFLEKGAGAAIGILTLSSNAHGMTSDEQREIDTIIINPRTQTEVDNLNIAQSFIRDHLNKRDMTNVKDLQTMTREFQDFYSKNPDAGRIVQRLAPNWAAVYNGVQIMSGGQGYTKSLANTAIGEALSNPYWEWKYRVRNALSSGATTPEEYKQLAAEGAATTQFGVSFLDTLKLRNPGTVKELSLLGKGYQYRFGFHPSPEFPDGQEAAQSVWQDIAFKRPNESELEYDARIRKKIANTEEVPQIVAEQISRHLQDNNREEERESFQKIRNNLYARVPLDQRRRLEIDSIKGFVFDNIDDPAELYTYFRSNPEVAQMVQQFDPKTYRTLENKVFGQITDSASRYLQASGFAPEAIDYVRRIAPRTYGRLFKHNAQFAALAESLGYQPPPEMNENIFTAQPEPLLPDPIPEGTFSSFPVTLNFVQRYARRQAVVLSAAQAQNPDSLTPQEVEFINASPAAQVFQSFPGVIGQAFREGKLQPQEIISSFRELSNYGLATGALDPDSHGNFNRFLQNSSTVFGATQFGFRLGQFLDDTFNIPRLPVQNKIVDFLLAGQPVSGGAPNLPGQALRLPISPVLIGANRDPFPSLGPTPGGGGQGEAALPGVAAGTGAAGTVARLAPAGTGLATLGTVFGVISAGFTIATLVRSGRAQRRARSAAAAQAADLERRRREALREQQVTADEALRRQLAEQRVRQFQAEERRRQQDFSERSRVFLSSGANFATFAQQPREFQDRFINEFPAEVLEFSRRPQFASRLNLIESVQGRLPRARY